MLSALWGHYDMSSWALILNSYWQCRWPFYLKAGSKLILHRRFWVQNTWTLHHRESPSLKDWQFRPVILLICTSVFSLFYQLHCCHPDFDSLCFVLYMYLYMPSHPFGLTMYLSSLACSRSDQTRAERLILAVRHGKPSQPFSISRLSVSVWSNTLPGCRYGHQRESWYFCPPCSRNSSGVSDSSRVFLLARSLRTYTAHKTARKEKTFHFMWNSDKFITWNIA